MIRARLWPASPRFPETAFTFELLDWAESLLLECQVALGDFCRSLYFNCPHLVKKRRDIYASMIDAFEEYRYLKMELRHMSFVSPKLDSGNICPACPKNDGSLFISMDALFGLPRKKSAGKSHRPPLHDSLFFKDQSSVDEYVSNSSEIRELHRTCNDFLAGSALRSANRYCALDETAVFGSACRHEFPLMFINLKHGERLSYAKWLLLEMVQNYPTQKLNIMYDIACKLHKNLLKSECSEVLEKIDLSIPSFHAFGHNAQCQAAYGPTRRIELGLSDGEVMERLWSYLRRFSRMTKEMRPSHRIDVLTHALLFYGSRTKQKLGTLLANRWKKAEGLKLAAQSSYEELTSSLPETVTEDNVKQWVEEDRVLISSCVVANSGQADWKITYVQLLHTLCTEDLSTLQYIRLKKQLEEFEKKHGIAARWDTSDPQYIAARSIDLKEKQHQLQLSLWSTVCRRQFLVKTKAKYADGQKIAKRLCKGISKETKKANKILSEHHHISLQLDPSYSKPNISQVLSPDSTVWQQRFDGALVSTHMPQCVKRDIIEAYLLKERCNKEQCLLKIDMTNVISYWQEKASCITALILETSGTDAFKVGCVCLLKKCLVEVEHNCSKVTVLFSNILENSESVDLDSENDSSDSEDDRSDSENDRSDIDVDD
ncbi:uncharacterized protein LOC135338993 isoform X3 [Halichondria panicea]